MELGNKSNRVSEVVQSPYVFNEVQKVLSVFGSEMDKNNVVRSSNTN